MNPNSPFILATLASFYIIEEKPERARKILEKSLTLDPNYYFSWHNLGLIYMQENKPDQALAAFKKAVANNPDDSSSWTNMAEIYKRAGNKNERAHALKMAAACRIGKTPGDLYRIAHSLEEMGLKKDASVVRKSGLDQDPDEADVLINVPYLMDQDSTKRP
ncbi:MAG TPA: tetratricopeptide repeat protein [Candidatus Melainabacteria bacterium]|nr:tetratricopeptide repeat protein [Candidatus Melainabacteria bacterium]